MVTKTQQANEIEYLYRRYFISIDIQEIAGGTPMDRGLVAGHISKFSEGVSNALKLSKKNEGEVSEEAMRKYMDSCSSGFRLDEDKGIFIQGYQFNAMVKDAAQRMKATMKIRGLGNTIRDGGLLFPDRIYLGTEPTIIERPVKPDNAPANIKIFQTARSIKLTLPCAVLENGDLSDQLFRQIWVVSQGIGIGANRHLGYGQFVCNSITQTGDLNITDLSTANGSNDLRSPVPKEIMAD